MVLYQSKGPKLRTMQSFLTSCTELLEGVLFANIRFHDTVSRGRLLNRFGKDFEGIDSNLPDNFGRSIINALSVATTFVTVSVVGGPPFMIAALIFGSLYYSSKSFPTLKSFSRSRQDVHAQLARYVAS